jgi:PAS domain S-box-containing protein
MSERDVRWDPAFPVMLTDILSSVLTRADNPSELGRYLTEELRELTGARCVLFLRRLGTEDNANWRALAVNPWRRLAWAESPAVTRLRRASQDMPGPHVWRSGEPGDIPAMLAGEGFDLSITMPLRIGPRQVGLMLVLGLPDDEHLQAEIRVLESISTVVALVLQNSFHFEEQERIIAERTRELETSNEQLRLTQFSVDSATEAIVWIDRDGRFLYVNDAACRLLGHSREEMLERSVPDINPARTPAAWLAHWTRLKQEHSLTFDAELRGAAGRRIPVEINANYVAFAGREFNCSFIRDVGERRRADAERARLEEHLRQAQRMESIGQLAGGVAHDFNNLLTPILGYAELLLEEPGDSRCSREALTAIQHAATRARDLTRQLLAFSRKQILSLKPVDLRDVVRGFEKLLRRTLREDIQIRIRLPEVLGIARADVGQIEQVLMNLAVNAQDAMPDGGMLTIELMNADLDRQLTDQQGGMLAGPCVLLAVSDTGTGMDNETRERLFDPFFTTKAKGRGTGLGLSTVFGIVRQHGGGIWVYSEPGQGSTFKIYLPQDNTAPPPTGRAAPAARDPRGTETVMVVEDTREVREVVTTLLGRRGYHVLTATGVEQCRQKIERHGGPIHLLLTDVIMPGLNGRQLYEQLLARQPGLKVLYMSGYTDDVIANRGVLEEGVQFIQKPFTARALAEKVRQALDAP